MGLGVGVGSGKMEEDTLGGQKAGVSWLSGHTRGSELEVGAGEAAVYASAKILLA